MSPVSPSFHSSFCLTRHYSLVVLSILFSLPVLITVAFAWSPVRRKKSRSSAIKCFLGITVLAVLETAVQYIYRSHILPLFFMTSTSTYVRFLLRMIGPVLFIPMGTEASWIMAFPTLERTDIDVQDFGTGLMVLYCVYVPGLGRVMQGSAEGIGESLIFEFAGTISELIMFDSLLRGHTPIEDSLKTLKTLVGGGIKRGPTKIATYPRAEGTKRQRSTVEQRRVWKLRFCETAIILLVLSEGTTLLTSFYYWLLMNGNPNEPGSPAIPMSQVRPDLIPSISPPF